MTFEVDIANVSGIKSGHATIESGVNAVRASNWQGKTSLLDALQVAMGTKTTLTEGTDSGQVRLRLGEAEYTVELVRNGTEVSRTGEPYLTAEYDRVRAELFAFLDESNPIRRAVRAGETLEPLLTRPLDFENIDERIADLTGEREQIEREIERATDAADELPGVIEDIREYESERDELTAELDEIDTVADDDIDAKREGLSASRAERDRIENRVERLRETIERTETKLSEQRAALDSTTVPDEDDIEAELETQRSKQSAVERDLELLRSVYEANERVLAENRVELVTDVEHDVLDDSIGCWVCGADADRDAFETRLAGLRERISALEDRATRHRDRVAELETRREEVAASERRVRDLENEIDDLERQLTERRESLQTAESNLESVRERVETLEAEVEETDDARTELESRRKYVERELDDLRERQSTLESRAEQRELLVAEREELTEEIESLRGRKEAVKRELRETFDGAIDEVVDRFETGFETARLTGNFDVVVAREGREASLDALSEGERELLGIAVALAGYLTFDVAEDVPLLMLDGLGGLADENLQALVDFLEPYPDALVLTAYPEHRGFTGHELDPTEWSVVSRELAGD